MEPNRGVYVLALQRGGFYVGSSDNLGWRMHQHKNLPPTNAFVVAQGGAKRPLAPDTTESPCLRMWEMHETLHRMMKHGHRSVRGWEFCDEGLEYEDLVTIRTCTIGTFDLCRQCGRSGHQVAKCKYTTAAKWMRELDADIAVARMPDLVCGRCDVAKRVARPTRPKRARTPVRTPRKTQKRRKILLKEKK